MKILVIGLGGAAPELLFGDERLTNIRRLMDGGCYGRLKSVIPPTMVPAWICMATSQDPGSLGVYGLRNRRDYSYGDLEAVTSGSVGAPAIWDQVAREGKRAVIVGVPPSYPPRKVNGICVGCFLTPDVDRGDYTYPPEVARQIADLVGEYPVDVRGFRTEDKGWLKDQVYTMSRKQFGVMRHLLQSAEWDYFQFVEIGLDRLQHGFWRFHDPQHALHRPDSPYGEAIRDYYLYLDDELGRTLDLVSEETAVLVVSNHGAQRLDGAFCVNEWLVKEGLLALREYPDAVTSFARLSVDWDRTTVWGEGGHCACLFFNVKGREPCGAIDEAEYESLRDDLKARLEGIVDGTGRPLGARVLKPEEIYRGVRSVAPDLIVSFDGLHRRALGSVGRRSIHAQPRDFGPDDCTHTMFGGFILAGPNNPLYGEVEGAELLDMAPTLLELGGYDVPASMQGRSLVAGKAMTDSSSMGYSADEEAIIRERLAGLGYIA